MISLVVSFFILLVSAEITSAEGNPDTEISSQPRCFPVEQVKERKKDPKYLSIKKIFSDNNISSEEIVARLIYAETKAAGEACQKHDEKIADYIAQVIRNRYTKLLEKNKNGDAAQIVFQPMQFASSIHKYSESRIQDFLCPKNSNLWSRAVSNAKRISQKTPLPKSFENNVFNYYLFQHSTRFDAPEWTQTLKEAPIKEKEIGACIRFYKNPAYKP